MLALGLAFFWLVHVLFLSINFIFKNLNLLFSSITAQLRWSFYYSLGKSAQKPLKDFYAVELPFGQYFGRHAVFLLFWGCHIRNSAILRFDPKHRCVNFVASLFSLIIANFYLSALKCSLVSLSANGYSSHIPNASVPCQILPSLHKWRFHNI